MKILVIQQKMIGDVLASTIICEHIKENIAGAEVHYVVNSHTEAVVVNNPFIDRIILFAPKYRDNKFEFYRFLKDVRKEKYNVVIDAYGKLESNLISFFSGADIKISYPKWYSRFIYTHVVPKLNNSDTQKGLAIENRVKLLSPIIPTINNPDKAPKIYLTHEETIATKEFLLNNRIDLSKPLLMLGILGSGKDKTYPLGYMAKIINTIAEDYDVTMLFNYIPSQEKEAKELFNLCTKVAQHKIAINVFAPSLRSFLGLLSHCNAIVGNEGGAINMAKALDIPTFSVYSPWITKLAWHTFNDSDKNVAVHLGDFYPEKIEGKSRQELKKETQELYRLFKPSLFTDELKKFLGREIVAGQ